MSNYFVGDIHGCFNELNIILKKVLFNPKKDNLWITGDLIARGPESLKVLCFIHSLGKNAKLVLGNHDLHLISSYYGINNIKNKNYVHYLLNYHNSHNLINWLRKQPLLQIDEKNKIIMTHAGVSPQWDFKTIKNCALEVNKELSSNYFKDFLELLNKEAPNSWNDNLNLSERLQFTVNALTKMRYCNTSGELNINIKKIKKNNSLKLKPWFNISSKISSQYNIIFGHWSCVSKNYNIPKNIFALDTGCCWGNELTILRWEDKKFFTQKYLI